MTVAALYIDPRGPYPKIPGVDCWDATRDARIYTGPDAVVAHPPCGPWGKLKHLYRGDEHGCGPRAVAQTRANGGVLEHPAGSALWEHCGLPLPGAPVDMWGGYSIEVEQVSWGHVARKRTWLYLVRVPLELVRATIRAGGEPTQRVSGGGTGRGKTPPGIKICSAQQRRRTPSAFAEWLVMLARSV